MVESEVGPGGRARQSACKSCVAASVRASRRLIAEVALIVIALALVIGGIWFAFYEAERRARAVCAAQREFNHYTMQLDPACWWNGPVWEYAATKNWWQQLIDGANAKSNRTR